MVPSERRYSSRIITSNDWILSDRVWAKTRHLSLKYDNLTELTHWTGRHSPGTKRAGCPRRGGEQPASSSPETRRETPSVRRLFQGTAAGYWVTSRSMLARSQSAMP